MQPKYQKPSADPSAAEAYDEAGGERRLIVAIIERAFLDAPVMQQAREWLFDWGPGAENEEWSFPWACDYLGVDAATVADYAARRLGIPQWRGLDGKEIEELPPVHTRRNGINASDRSRSYNIRAPRCSCGRKRRFRVKGDLYVMMCRRCDIRISCRIIDGDFIRARRELIRMLTL